jgi:hypothetical protein
MLKCDGTDKGACKIVNGASKARFDGCSFATVDNEAIRMFDGTKGEYEFYGCEINFTTGYDYLFSQPIKLIMQNCNVKTRKNVCFYNSAMDSCYVLLNGNVFDTTDHIFRASSGTTFTTSSIALLNNIRNNVSKEFVYATAGVTATDINNNKI